MDLRTRAELGTAVAWRSLQVVAVRRTLLAYPVLSWLSLVGSAAALAASLSGRPVLATVLPPGVAVPASVATAEPLLAFVAGAVLTTTFNVALVNNAVRHLRGEDPRVRDGLYAALGSFGRVIVWGLLSSSVAVPLAVVERLDRSEQLLAAVVGGSWSASSLLVAPVLAFESVRIERVLDRSRQLFRKGWGMSSRASTGLGLVVGTAAAPFVAVGAYARLADLAPPTADLLTAVAVVGLLVVALVRQVVLPVSRAALYIHAATARTPRTFADLDLAAIGLNRKR